MEPSQYASSVPPWHRADDSWGLALPQWGTYEDFRDHLCGLPREDAIALLAAAAPIPDDWLGWCGRALIYPRTSVVEARAARFDIERILFSDGWGRTQGWDDVLDALSRGTPAIARSRVRGWGPGAIPERLQELLEAPPGSALAAESVRVGDLLLDHYGPATVAALADLLMPGIPPTLEVLEFLVAVRDPSLLSQVLTGADWDSWASDARSLMIGCIAVLDDPEVEEALLSGLDLSEDERELLAEERTLLAE